MGINTYTRRRGNLPVSVDVYLLLPVRAASLPQSDPGAVVIRHVRYTFSPYVTFLFFFFTIATSP